MSGKFMKIRKVCISTLTLLILTSQLAGCASATQKEMLTMYNNNQSITIEIAEPISQEQGTEVFVDWTELASLNNYDAFRMEFDDILGITAHGEAGKNGVIYVDLEGNHTNNSTLYYAFANAKFRDTVWNDSDKCNEIINAAQSIYTDVEGGKPALLAAYNAYFNLLNDSEPGYANMYSTITRLEAMSMILKADTPVYKIEVNEQFASTVGNEQLAPYAQEMNDYSFLKADNLSLDSTTANGTITRGEFVYMIVQRYFADDYAKVTGKESCYSDAKNGGDVATKIGLITTDKETGVTSAQNRCESYELSYCLQDEKAGIPEEIYKALVVAQQKGLITGSECRWSDGIIKGEALTILTNAYSSMNTVTSADRGTSSGEVVNNENIPNEENTGSDSGEVGNNENSTTNNENPTENEGDIPKEDINDIGNGVEEGVVDENNIENQTPAESTEQPVAPTEQPAQQSAGKPANIPVEEYPIFREELGLTDEQLATITEEELMELIHEKMIKDRQERMENYKPSSSPSDSGSSSGGSGVNEDPGSLKPATGIPDDEVLPGQM